MEGGDLMAVTQATFTSEAYLAARYTQLGRQLGLGATSPAELYAWQLQLRACLLYTSPSPRDRTRSRMPSSA